MYQENNPNSMFMMYRVFVLMLLIFWLPQMVFIQWQSEGVFKMLRGQQQQTNASLMFILLRRRNTTIIPHIRTNNPAVISVPLDFKLNASVQVQEEDTYQESPSPNRTELHKPEVCVLIPVTSSKQKHWMFIQDSFVYQYPLQSLKMTCEPEKYAYRVLIGYDSDDRFFNSATLLSSLNKWSQFNLPFVNLTTVSIPNPKHKPGPVMNVLSRKAYDTGCDFMYRINDDTELVTPRWTSAFIEALASFKPPMLGVVGPTCREGNTDILTHDFVHRTHLDIFPTHYPIELTDWWLDDWITAVYGTKNTLKLHDVYVTHHILTTRYEVSWGSSKKLSTLLSEGNQTLQTYFNALID